MGDNLQSTAGEVLRPLGATGLSVSQLTVGTGRWRQHDPGVGPRFDDACAVIERVVADGRVTVIDTSNNYGFGQSEEWIHAACARVGQQADRLLVQTKADRSRSDDFSGERMRASVEESMSRLAMARLPLVFLHDPDYTTWDEAMAAGGPVEALLAMRDEGLIGALGVAGGAPELMLRFVETDLFEAVITHNRYTLVDRSAETVIAAAAARGMGIYNAAPYGGGLLARWPDFPARYRYREAPPSLMRRVERVGRMCERFEVPIAAAALQWSMRDRRISSTIVGMENVRDYEATLSLADLVLPDALWSELEDIVDVDDTWAR